MYMLHPLLENLDFPVGLASELPSGNGFRSTDEFYLKTFVKIK